MACSYYYYHVNSDSFFISDIKEKFNFYDEEVVSIGLCSKYNTWELYKRLKRKGYNHLITINFYYLRYNKNSNTFD